MRIVLLPSPEGEVIAREDQDGHFEAEFVVTAEGHVLYRHPWDRPWFAGQDAASFREAATAWNRYCDEGRDCQTDENNDVLVERLRSELSRLGMLDDRPDNLWTCLLEQAQDGLI